MKHLMKIEEHILDKIGSSSTSHILSKLSHVTPNSLISGELYEHSFVVKSGDYEGEVFKSVQRFIKKDRNNYIFRIVKIYSPEIAEKLDIQLKDLIKVKEENLINYHQLN